MPINQPGAPRLPGSHKCSSTLHLFTKLKAIGDAVVEVNARNPGELGVPILKIGGKDAKIVITPRCAGLRANRKFANEGRPLPYR